MKTVKQFLISYAVKALQSYEYVELGTLVSLFNKKDINKIIEFLQRKQIIDKDGNPTLLALEDLKFSIEIYLGNKTLKLFKWDEILKLINSELNITFDIKKYNHIYSLGFGLNYIFKKGDIIYDVDGKDRKGYGKGVIVDVSPDFLKVEFENKDLPVLVNKALFTYDRAGRLDAKRCYTENEFLKSKKKSGT